jgi:hypothetical protein
MEGFADPVHLEFFLPLRESKKADWSRSHRQKPTAIIEKQTHKNRATPEKEKKPSKQP